MALRHRLVSVALTCTAAIALCSGSCVAFAQGPSSAGSAGQNISSGRPASTGLPAGGAPKTGGDLSGTVVQIHKNLTGDFTYRFVTDKDQTSAPAPLPAAATADAAVPVSIPSSISAKSAILEVTDKGRGNVARIPVGTGGPIQLTEASFTLVQSVYVTVQKDSKPVTDVLVTMADATHKFSLAWLLKASDKGVAQFSNVPMGEPITVAINGAGHPVISQTSTLLPGHPADGYHWPTISIDWPDAATVAPAVVAAPATPPVSSSTDRESPGSGTSRSDHGEERNGGGFFSSLLNDILAIGVIALIVWGAIYAFNKGHVKALLDKAGINTAEMSPGNTPQPSPFDKPAREPLTPITEGTADPFGGGAVGHVGVAAVMVSGPRLVATAGAYSGTIFPLAGHSADLGRDASNAVPLPNDTNSSRRHATIMLAGDQTTITDNSSSNGTFVNGVRIAPNAPQPLRSGDEVHIGMTRFRFEA